MKKKSPKKLILKIVISIILFIIIFQSINFSELVSNFKQFNLIYFPLVFLLIVLNYVISSVRWKYLMVHQDDSNKVKIPYLTSLYFIGAFFNNFLPTSIGGDGYKFYRLGKKTGNMTNAFTSTFMERFTGVIALVVISLLSLTQLLGIYGIGIFILFWFCVVCGLYFLKFISKIKFKYEFLNKLISQITKIYQSIAEYKHHKKRIFWAIVTSFIVQILSVLSQYFVFYGLGVEIPFFYAFFSFPFIFLAGYAVPTFNGIGIQDYLYIELFSKVGVASELALSASILYHLFRLSVSLIGGILYVFERD